jgi:Fe-S-cluster containining protein
MKSGENMKSDIVQMQTANPFNLNKETAYTGSLGRAREAFCLNFIQKKQKIFETYRMDQVKVTTNNREMISCRPGCVYCCRYYMHASIQECEAIVYYLYHNEAILSAFMKNYGKWRKRLKQNGDIFNKCGEMWAKTWAANTGEDVREALQEADGRYRKQNIYCPFLVNDTCAIYEVRPFTCAALVATTPNDWCGTSSTHQAKLYITRRQEPFDTSFYYGQIEQNIVTFMPIFVRNILMYGYEILSAVPGLEGLDKAAKEKDAG